MKNTIRIAVAVALLLLVGERGLAAEKSNAKTDLQELITKVQGKLKEGKNTEPDLADNLKEFDTLLAKYKDEKTDEVAQILLMKAMLYLQVLENTDRVGIPAEHLPGFLTGNDLVEYQRIRERPQFGGCLLQG